MQNGFHFASFRLISLRRKKYFEAKPAHPISELACVNALVVSTYITKYMNNQQTKPGMRIKEDLPYVTL
jgi:hypothetical protein